MAIIFGGRSAYLYKKILVVIISPLAVGIIFAFVWYSNENFLRSLGLLVIVIGAALIAAEYWIIKNLLEKRFNRINSGLRGEAMVARELKKLPDEFAVFRGIKVKEHLDADCAVVGPTGIFVLEVKGHYGEIGFNGYRLTRNGRPVEKDFFRETSAEAKGLRALIRAVCQVDVYVESAIVFSRAAVRLGPQKINGSYVIGKSRLGDFLTGGTRPFNGATVINLAMALAGATNEPKKNEKMEQFKNAINHLSL